MTGPPTVEYEAGDTAYTIRPFEPGDAADVAEFLADIWPERAGHRGADWVRWKFGDAPATDDTRVYLAESVATGELVAVRPYVGLDVSAEDERALGLLTVDVGVHPDHRGRGLFGRVEAVSLEAYTDDEPAFTMSFPNEAALGSTDHSGLRPAGRIHRRFRFQRSGPVARRVTDGRPAALLGVLAAPVVRGYLGIGDRFRSVDAGLSVRRYDDVPADLLASCYEREVPDRIHVRRSVAHYRWRFAGPHWESDPAAEPARAYVVRRDGEPIAGVVTVRRTHPPPERLRLMDAVPLVGGPERAAGLTAALDRIVADYPDVAHLEAATDAIPADVARRAGFISDARFPLSRLAGRKPLLTVRTLRPDGSFAVGERSVDDIDDWLVTHGEIW